MRFALVAATALVAACAGAPAHKAGAGGPVKNENGYALRLAEDQAVPYRGVITYDEAGLDHKNAVMYGPGAAGFVAGLIVHGAMLKSIRENQKSTIQLEADRVLTPYASILATFRHRDLVDAAVAASVAGKQIMRPDPVASWAVESAPVFSMTQDQRALVLDHVVAIQRVGSPKAAYQNTIRVVTTAYAEADPAAWWGADGGARLKAESVRLYRESLELTLRDAAKTLTAVPGGQKTVRYREGRLERMERAEVVESSCGRAVLRTLRGWLMSVPLSEPGDVCVVGVSEPGS